MTILRNDLVQGMMNVEFIPPTELVKANVDLKQTIKFPIEQAVALGIAFQPLTQLASYAATGAGQSGLYFVKTAGKTMFKSGGEFIGTLKADNGGVGGGLSRLTQIPCDPTMLCMAVVFMSIDKKLNTIYQTQKEILAFLELREEAKLKGNLNVLADVQNNYKFNWDNEKYKNNKHILVQEIKRDAEQSIIMFREQLEKLLNKNKLFKSDQDVATTINNSIFRLNDYQLALYTFSFSSFLEIMLLENFDSMYLQSISNKIKEYYADFIELREQFSQKLEKESKSSLQGYMLKGLSKISSETGKLVEKIPVVSKSQLDENLIKTGDKLQSINEKRTQNIMQAFLDIQTDYVEPFIQNIQTVDKLYNQPIALLFDNKNIYIA